MKQISAQSIIALKEALTNIYWYKSDLRSFITNTITNSSICNHLDWSDYKRNIASRLVDILIKNEKTTQKDLLKLIYEISNINNFTHLAQLEDGTAKVEKAKNSIHSLREMSKGYFDKIKEEEQAEKQRKKANDSQLKITAVKDKLNEIKKIFFDLVGSSNPQNRGYKLEIVIKDLFELFDLDPKASLKIVGEQIDGAFTFDNTDYILEAKWHKKPIAIDALDAFGGKLNRRLENTLGLFISINGFSEDAIQAYSTGRGLMILMDGSDLMAILEGRIDLIQLLLRKRRHASQTGNIYLKINNILA